MRVLREPLLHFLLVGGVLVLLRSSTRDHDTPIVVDDPFVLGLHEDHLRRTGEEDVDDERLVDTYIRDEVLYRRALALGLDEGDEIVRRRLIQKMELILEAQVALAEPTDAELSAYLDAHRDRYATAPRIAFEQRYFSADRRADARADATAAVSALRAGGDVASDPFLLGDSQTLTNQATLAQRFGPEFAAAAFGATTQEWVGPLQSRYGFHAIRVTERTAAAVPEVGSIRSELHHAWREEQRAERLTDAIRRLVEESLVVREP